MSSLAIGAFIGVTGLLLMLTGMPIAFALGIISVVSILLFLDPVQFNLIGNFVYSSMDDFTMLSIPLFIFMGAIFANSKASGDLFDTVQKWMGRLPGGLALSAVAASALFAALSGSSPATAAAIGKSAIPEMRKRGYSEEIATGVIVAGGTLGILIPPSITLILYGIAVEVSIGKLFLAGVIPGILLSLMFCAYVIFAVKWEKRRNGQSKTAQAVAEMVETRYSWNERFRSLIQVIPFLLLILGVLFVLYAGVATPSEAAAVGAILALIMVIVIYRSLTWKKLMTMLLETTKESTMILMIIAFSALIGVVLSFLSIPQDLAQTITGLDVNRWVILGIINILLLALGCFMPPAAIIVMTAPILLPILIGLNFDPLWFGIIMTINMEAGLITPPVGLNLFVVRGIAPDISLAKIIRGSVPYVFVIILCIVILSIFPEIVTWLPNRVIGT
jgi:C4-dicarboxylate transporter DctM subunit